MTRVRALVVDDSATARELLRTILSEDGDIEVVGEAANGADAVTSALALRPSIVVMDIEMPGVDGFEATKRIMTEAPTPIVIVTACHDPRDVAVTLRATEMGALTVLPKPPGPASPTFAREAAGLRAIVKALADVKVVRRRWGRRVAVPVPEAGGANVDDSLRAVGVGASTGGPPALYRFLGALPRDLAVPVLVVQHISKGFVSGLVRWLAAATPIPVSIAEHGAPLTGARVYVAPDDQHLEVGEHERIVLSTGPLAGGFRPSASVLFESMARVYGSGATAVVLTGMGDDGVRGARAVRAAGGRVLAQDEETSTVFGMPRAVVHAGLADIVGPVEVLAARLPAPRRQGGS